MKRQFAETENWVTFKVKTSMTSIEPKSILYWCKEHKRIGKETVLIFQFLARHENPVRIYFDRPSPAPFHKNPRPVTFDMGLKYFRMAGRIFKKQGFLTGAADTGYWIAFITIT